MFVLTLVAFFVKLLHVACVSSVLLSKDWTLFPFYCWLKTNLQHWVVIFKFAREVSCLLKTFKPESRTSYLWSRLLLTLKDCCLFVVLYSFPMSCRRLVDVDVQVNYYPMISIACVGEQTRTSTSSANFFLNSTSTTGSWQKENETILELLTNDFYDDFPLLNSMPLLCFLSFFSSRFLVFFGRSFIALFIGEILTWKSRFETPQII